MIGRDRIYRGRVFKICPGSSFEPQYDSGSYRGLLEFKNEDQHQFVTQLEEITEGEWYRLSVSVIDSFPSAHGIIRIVEVDKVSKP